MQVIHLSYPFENPHPNGGTQAQVLAIGDFDGVHLGHREVINRTLATARQVGLPAGVLTFHPHPREVLGHDKYKQVLTPLDDKLALLAQFGIERAYVARFDRELSQVSPDDFVEKGLLPLSVHSVLVGFDFTFGRRAAGTADSLCKHARGRFSVEVVRPFRLHGEKVSSTRIRECLETGAVGRAAELLGRCYTFSGIVEAGNRLGRTIGFPTANLALSANYVVPRRGVYAVRASVRGERRQGVMNIGVKPTVQEGRKETVEVHLFDFSGDLYGETVVVEIVEFLREERKFPSVAELTAQIRKDADEARALLQNVQFLDA